MTVKSKSSLKPWAFEIAALASSIAMLIAMAVLLAAYDEKSIFDGKVWTLNALVSTLSTASKATLLTVVASCISQGNWLLFSGKPRRLYDFEMVAEASRGPLGSLKVLVSRSLRGGSLVRLGALATILTLAMDPFSQQLVQLHQSHDRRRDAASIPYASRYSLGSSLLMAGMVGTQVTDDGRIELGPDPDLYVYADADFAMQAAIVFGLTASQDAVEQQASFRCPAPECTFKALDSLAVCSRCSDVTGKLEKNNDSGGDQYSDLSFDKSAAQAKSGSTEYRLPNGLFLNNMDDEYGPSDNMVYMTMRGTSDPNKTVAMDDVDTLIWSQTVIKVDADPESKTNKMWPEFEVQASECALYYCVKSYTAESKDGLISMTSRELKDEQQRNPDSWASLDRNLQRSDGVAEDVLRSLAYHPKEAIITRSDLQLHHDGANKTGWNVSQEAVYGISYYMQNLFAVCLNGEENCTQALEDWDVPNGFYISRLSNRSGEEKQAEQYRPSSAKVFWETQDLNETFGNIAASMSNAIRDGADGEEGKGDALKPTTIYVVVWPWIILHCATQLGALILLILTFLSTAQRPGAVPVWKSSELAVFSKGVVVGDVLKEARTTEQLEERARHASVVLVSAEGGTQLHDTDGLPLVERGARSGEMRPRESEAEAESLDSRNKTFARDAIHDTDLGET
ncbi:hypothetical protein ACJ41O_009537 [Fusarium nematophilum]